MPRRCSIFVDHHVASLRGQRIDNLDSTGAGAVGGGLAMGVYGLAVQQVAAACIAGKPAPTGECDTHGMRYTIRRQYAT
ncbi:hypothetical protein GCM10011247_16270 [Pseudomonas plecoglossicida]|nr:hypothetical protein GCM10011247_16270 [Pseudomonas plecoglossicida]